MRSQQYEISAMLTEEDVNGKAYVHWKSWQQTYTGMIPQEILDKQTLDICQKMAFRWRDGVIVAKCHGDVIGFAATGECRDADMSETREIIALYVLQEHQGKGVGYALLNEAQRRLGEGMPTVLWVLKENARAIRFYQRQGYSFDGAEKSSSAGTELRMRRDK